MNTRNLATASSLLARLQAAMQRHERARIVALAREIVALAPPLGEQWLGVARVVGENGEIGLGRAALDLLVAEANGAPVAVFRQAGMLSEFGLWEDAHRLVAGLPSDTGGSMVYAHARGNAAMLTGRTAEAREWLAEAVRIRPQTGHAWLSLATITDFAKDEALSAMVLEQASRMDTAPAWERGVFNYALGRVHADRGEHGPAFAAFSEGGRLFRQKITYDRERARRFADEGMRGYSAEAIADLASRQTQPTASTIFVTGLPRSGTSLVEQILTSHSTVGDGAEINRLGLLAREIGGPALPSVSAYVAQHGAEGIAGLWDHWMADWFADAGRVIDKTTCYGRLLGLAATLLPDAPLIWLTRDPLDCAWSCFRNCFLESQPWSCDLADIAFHFRLEQEMLGHWKKVLGDRLLVVPYEGLASEPEAWIHRIMDHCGLSFEPQVFTPQDNPRAVATASRMQVRQPISRMGIGVAAPYREFLQPFQDAFDA